MPAVKKKKPKVEAVDLPGVSIGVEAGGAKFDAVIYIRATPEEKAAWEAAAKRAGRSLASWLRWVGQRALQEAKK